MNKQISLEAALAMIKSGDTVASSGFMGCGAPRTLLNAIAESGISDLTLISSDTAKEDYASGKLIAAGKVKKLYASHIGTNKTTQKQFIEGSLEVEFVPQGTLAEKLRATKSGLGGVLTKTGLGTEVQEGKQVVEVNGDEYLLEPAFPKIDVCLIRGCLGDASGNLTYRGTAMNFADCIAGAGAVTIAEVEKILPNGELDENLIRTPFIFVDHVIQATF